jgi:lipid-binding SYLF domain-containing protein
VVQRGETVKRRGLLGTGLSLLVAGLVGLQVSAAAAQDTSTSALAASAKRAYERLVATVPAAKVLSKNAVAVLVFPRITRVGLIFGGQYGEGVLLRDGNPAGYYSNFGASWGLKAGVKTFGYAMFFMNETALGALSNTHGFEVGVGPSVVVVDQGMSQSLTTMNMANDVYAFIFTQQGLFGGVGIQGNKITRVDR